MLLQVIHSGTGFFFPPFNISPLANVQWRGAPRRNVFCSLNSYFLRTIKPGTGTWRRVQEDSKAATGLLFLNILGALQQGAQNLSARETHQISGAVSRARK